MQAYFKKYLKFKTKYAQKKDAKIASFFLSNVNILKNFIALNTTKNQDHFHRNLF